MRPIKRNAVILIGMALGLIASGCGGGSRPVRWYHPTAKTASPRLEPYPVPEDQGVSEDDYARLILEQQQDVPLTQARGARPAEAPPELPVPRSHVVDRAARLEKSQRPGWYIVRFLDARDGEPSPWRYVLFSQYLAQIQPLADRSPPVSLRVSGETTCYKSWPFVLLTSPPVIVENRRPPAVGQVVVEPPESPAAIDAVTPEEGVTSAEGIRDTLLRGRSQRIVPVPPAPRAVDVEPAPSVAPAPARQGLSYGAPEMVIDRLIRLVPERQEGWLTARFESDNTIEQPPLRLLPCRQLEKAERLAAQETVRMARFKVSGRVTTYQGQRYLLLNKLIRVRNMDQF